MKKHLLLLILLLFCTLLLGKSYYAQDYNCLINVRDNGDLHIRETFRYHFSGGTYSWVTRYIPERATDGLEFIRAFVKDTDGNILSEVDDYKFSDDKMLVKWTFEPVMDESLDFELEFVAHHVLYIEDNVLMIDYLPLPKDHDFVIEQGRIELILPGKLPSVLGVFSNTSDKVEVSYTENSVVYNFHDLDKDEVFPVGMTLADDAIPVEKPHWQEIDEIQTYYGKYFLMILFVIILIIILLSSILIKASRRHKQLFTPDELPDDIYKLHPGLVAKLVNGFDNSVIPYASLFYRLLKLDYVNIESRGKKKYTVILSESIPSDPIDKFFYEILQQFIDKNITDLKKMFSKFHKHKEDMNYELMTGLYDQGYVDEMQHSRQKKFHLWTLISLILFLLTVISGIISFSYGHPLLLFCSTPFTLFFIYFVYRSSLIEVFTPQGFAEKYTWELWKKSFVHDLKKNPEKISADNFDLIFPYSLIMDFATKYIDFFKKSGISLTESKLMQHFDSMDDFTTFITVYIAIAASTGSSGSPGGAGTGGAGGGGAAAG